MDVLAACGTVPALFISTDKPIYLCQHPIRGLSWAFLSTDLNDPEWWRPVTPSGDFDGYLHTYNMHCAGLLFQAIRVGRYSLQQFLADVLTREAQQL